MAWAVGLPCALANTSFFFALASMPLKYCAIASQAVKVVYQSAAATERSIDSLSSAYWVTGSSLVAGTWSSSLTASRCFWLGLVLA